MNTGDHAIRVMTRVIRKKIIVKQDLVITTITVALNNVYVNMVGGVILMVIVFHLVMSAQYRRHVKRKTLLTLTALVIVNLTVMDGLATIIGAIKAVHVRRALSCLLYTSDAADE